MRYLFFALIAVIGCTRGQAPEPCPGPYCEDVLPRSHEDESLDFAEQSPAGNGRRERNYEFPCEAQEGTWSNCWIDRRSADGYSIPEAPPLESAAPDAEPWVQASVGNLAGGARDGIVFTDVFGRLAEDGSANPGYLCALAGQYESCPEELGLPQVEGLIIALALEHIDLDEKPDLLIATLETVEGHSVMEEAAELYSGTAEFRLKLQFYSQEWDQESEWPHWVNRTDEVGLADPANIACAPSNLQLVDLNGDGVQEVVMGGFMCPPHLVWSWSEEGNLVRSTGWLPDEIGTNAGIFVGPTREGQRDLFLIAYDGHDRNDPIHGGSSCWTGSPTTGWASKECPSMGGSPMGFTLLDHNKDSLYEVATSDVGKDGLCAHGMGQSPGGVVCFDSSWKLPGGTETLEGETRHNVSWAVTHFDDTLVYVQGYEHAFEYAPDLGEMVPWPDWPQQIHIYTTSSLGDTWERVRDEATDTNVHERGLVGPVDLTGDGCVDLAPLPVGLTPMRILTNGTCAPGAQEVAFRIGAQGAYGTEVILIAGDTRQATMITSGGGFAGFGPPVKSIAPHVTELEVHWTTGDVTRHTRDVAGEFPSIIRLNRE